MKTDMLSQTVGMLILINIKLVVANIRNQISKNLNLNLINAVKNLFVKFFWYIYSGFILKRQGWKRQEKAPNCPSFGFIVVIATACGHVKRDNPYSQVDTKNSHSIINTELSRTIVLWALWVKRYRSTCFCLPE